MSSKLTKLMGRPRIAEHDMVWKDFHLRKGYAYGLDDDGKLFVCPGTPPVKGYLFVWRANDDDAVICSYRRQETRGSFSRMIGRRTVVMESGYHGSEWGLRWFPSRIPIASPLAQRIIAAKRRAAPCEENKYAGVLHIAANRL